MSTRFRRPASSFSVCLALLVGCSAGAGARPADRGPDTSRLSSADVRPPRPGTAFDYQLGRPYPPADAVRAISRDHTAKPATGLYNVCYVNAFQSQPGESVGWWRRHHPGALLRDDGGALVIDEDWQEPLFDISSPHRRVELGRVVGRWIDGCAKAGFDAVELDNLDSYQRSDGRLSTDDATAFARSLAHRAHRRGLAVAQKNTAELLARRTHIGFDFAVVEECARYRECADFAEAYDGRVFDVEYRSADFTAGCREWSGEISLVLRNRDVRPAGERGYVHRHC